VREGKHARIPCFGITKLAGGKHGAKAADIKQRRWKCKERQKVKLRIFRYQSDYGFWHGKYGHTHSTQKNWNLFLRLFNDDASAI
jgi:hypothetical protein